jgi:hypothetical protein
LSWCLARYNVFFTQQNTLCERRPMQLLLHNAAWHVTKVSVGVQGLLKRNANQGCQPMRELITARKGLQINGSIWNRSTVQGNLVVGWRKWRSALISSHLPSAFRSAYVLNLSHLQSTSKMANPTKPQRRFRLRYVAAFLALSVSVIIGALVAYTEDCNVTPFRC